MLARRLLIPLWLVAGVLAACENAAGPDDSGEYGVTVVYEGQLRPHWVTFPPARPTASLNDRGQVVFSGADGFAYLWERGTLVRLREGEAWDINEHGQVAGSASGLAVVWDADRTMRTVFHRPEGISRAVAVNDAGEAAVFWKYNGGGGFCGTGSVCSTILARVRGDSTTIILTGVIAEPAAMNAAGWVAGYFGRVFHPFVIRDTVFTAIALDAFESVGNNAYACDINSEGVMVGVSGTQARYWDATGSHSLAGAGGVSVAYGINDAGTISGVTGASGLPGYHAAVWKDLRLLLLDDLVGAKGWTFTAAIDVNENGQILAIGEQSGSNQEVLVLLDPAS